MKNEFYIVELSDYLRRPDTGDFPGSGRWSYEKLHIKISYGCSKFKYMIAPLPKLSEK